jgi:hypothetical protein
METSRAHVASEGFGRWGLGRAALVLAGVIMFAAGLVGCSATPESAGFEGSTTSELQGTGDMSFDTLVDNFETLVQAGDIPGALPYSLLSTDNLDWLVEASLPATISEMKGYRCANGDVVVVFSTTALIGTGELLEAQEAALFEVARKKYPDRQVWAHSTVSYVVAAGDQDRMHRLRGVAQWAAVGGGVLTPR